METANQPIVEELDYRKMKMRKEPKDRRRDCSGEHLHDWEDFYRERSNPDRIIAGTHGVPCGAGCTMLIEVKDGIIISERPAALPTRQDGIQASPGRCCACGLTGSDYLYSSSRVSTPLIRKTLLDDWRATRSQHENPVEAWGALVNRPDRRRRWQRARGKGGFVPVTWDVATELICSSLLHTIEQKGPNHVYGSASSPGSSMVSYASGSRFLQLLGGVTLGSGDREQGICNAAALTWGEQGDVPEAAAWFEAQLLVVLGEEFQAAAPADHGVLIEAQQRGSTLWVIAQEYDLLARNADNWLELNASETATLWAAINHVILTEFFGNQAELQFTDYVSRFTDGPLLVELSRSSDGYTVGGLLNSDRIQQLQSQERTGSGFLVWDGTTESPRKVTGTRSDRLSGREGAWNLKPANSEEQAMDPLLSIGARPDTAVWVQIGSEDGWSLADGEVPTFELKSSQGEPIIVTTVFDLLMARYGVLRRPASTEGIADNTRDEYLERASQITGTEPLRLRALAREFARSAIDSKGKCIILTSPAFTGQDGSQSALNAAIDALLLCGCPGAVGGGFGFYSGFSRTSLNDAWSPLAFATDWIDSPRTMPAQAWHASHGSLQPFPDDHHWDSASPAVWLIWNGDALSANATGHEYDLLNLLGTHSTVVSQESPGAGPDQAGLLDLIVTLNFRLDTSAFYSDLILPATTWYEKEDLNSALTHPFIQPIRKVVSPPGSARSEWQIFAQLAKGVSRLASQQTAPKVRKCSEVYERFTRLGPNIGRSGLEMRGLRVAGEVIAQVLGDSSSNPENTDGRVSLMAEQEVCEVLLRLSGATNPGIAEAGLSQLEILTGTQLPRNPSTEKTRIRFQDVCSEPQLTLDSPLRTGSVNRGPYSPFSWNVEHGIPWRTPTGRQQFFRRYSEVPADRGTASKEQKSDSESGPSFTLSIVPSRWNFGSVYSDLSRVHSLGGDLEPIWISPEDAARLRVEAGDWVEVLNDHGVLITKVQTSRSIRTGTCRTAASQRILGVPAAPSRDLLRGGGPGSLSQATAAFFAEAREFSDKDQNFDFLSAEGKQRQAKVFIKKINQVKY